MSEFDKCVAAAPMPRTTRGHADDTYEHLIAAHQSLDNVVACLYGEDCQPQTCPVESGIHGTVAENSRLAAALRERLDVLYGRL